MENFYFVICNISYFEDKDNREELEEYIDFVKVIKKDFERAIYLIKEKNNNENLISELNQVINNITVFHEYIQNDDDFIFDLSDEFLYFDYGILKEKNNRVSITPCTVIVNRNYKEFYFIHDDLVNRFSVNENTIENKKYSMEKIISSYPLEPLEENITFPASSVKKLVQVWIKNNVFII